MSKANIGSVFTEMGKPKNDCDRFHVTGISPFIFITEKLQFFLLFRQISDIAYWIET